ncbi:MAG: SGNH/GDSL hydrolase family protein [Candidatus Omnitrophota bacterium]
MVKKILFSLVVVIIFLAIFEIISRFLFDAAVTKVIYRGDALGTENSLFKFSKDPVLLYERKDAPQVSADKKGVFRIIFLGDSVTYRGSWGMREYYPEILKGLLNERHPSLKYELVNAGVPGYNTIQEARYLEKRLLGCPPDMVVLGYSSTNDRTRIRKVFKYADKLYCSDTIESYPYVIRLPSNVNAFLLHSSSLYRFINYALASIIKKNKLGSKMLRIQYFDLTYETDSAIKKIKELSLKHNFRLLFVIFPFLGEGAEQECDWIINKCREYGVDYIEMRMTFKKTGYDKLRISDDDCIHPNKLGHQLTAEEIFRYMKKKNDFPGLTGD